MQSGRGDILLFDASSNVFGVFKEAAALDLLAGHGIRVTSQPNEASIIVGETRRQLLKHLARGNWLKHYFLYTDEPSYDWTPTPQSWLVPGLKRLQVMNVFTSDIFTDATSFLPHFGLSEPVPGLPAEADLRPRFQQKKTAAFLTYRLARETRRIVAGRNVDLNVRRIQLAVAGHARGTTDIYGAGFPSGFARSSTGWGATTPGEEWWHVKHRVLSQNYAFNLCAENTDWPNYITEKLWQPIRAHCLPIYFGKNNGVAALFPANSYVEMADFAEPAALFDFLETLSFDDFLERLRKCRDTYVHLLEGVHAGRTDSPTKRLNRLVKRVQATVSLP